MQPDPHTPDPTSVTASLERLRGGERAALESVLPLVYDELRRLASGRLRREDAGHTLGATALVHEAYLRLAQRERLDLRDRRHFLAVASQSMRRILVDHARAKKRDKRGGGRAVLPLEERHLELSERAADELVALDGALDRLARADARAADVVQRRFFAGLSLEEIAQELGVSSKTVQRDWIVARAWLKKEIDQTNPGMTQALEDRVGPGDVGDGS